MTYLIAIGLIALFGAGVFVGTLVSGAKLKAIEGEVENYATSMNSEVRGFISAVRKHL